jgi:hypothetical protein
MRCCQLALAWEPLLLSTQSVIFLRLKSGFVWFVGGGFCWVFWVVGNGYGEFAECQCVVFDGFLF